MYRTGRGSNAYHADASGFIIQLMQKKLILVQTREQFLLSRDRLNRADVPGNHFVATYSIQEADARRSTTCNEMLLFQS